MINGVHMVLYTKDAEADRAFLRDVLGFDAVDGGDGWLIFALPPAELGAHPHDKEKHELFLLCDERWRNHPRSLGQGRRLFPGKGPTVGVADRRAAAGRRFNRPLPAQARDHDGAASELAAGAGSPTLCGVCHRADTEGGASGDSSRPSAGQP